MVLASLLTRFRQTGIIQPHPITMGIPTIVLLTTVILCVTGQLTRDPESSTTEGRVSCLEDTYVRLESYATLMRTEMAVIEGVFFCF